MDEQITQLDRRLTSVEKEVAVLVADTASTLPRHATKEDVAKVEIRVSVIQSNYATKEDLVKLEAKVSAFQSIFATKDDLAKLEAKVSAIQANYATKGDIADLKLYLAKLETRMTVWAVAAFVSISSVVVSVVKLWP
ncbi:hypothetical protein GTP91_09415 [Rugamonas sp. FT82W]|uniref:DUF1640 domain-containing protein n=1 Tax=Duganella vulcania TaxID=2692166 RepID=A0A845G301_9BURK|nr:hypothetical protein [Duganella vulcania]MYM87396.1 hypothetical protein [Duganella vulcania]